MDAYPIRPGRPEDLESLLKIETLSFESDRFSRRSFLRWLQSDHAVLLVLSDQSTLLGYGLVILQRGTRLSRLYSLAVLPDFRQRGLATRLIRRLEEAAVDAGRLAMRLELGPENKEALRFFEHRGYRTFTGDAASPHAQEVLRLQKRIRFPDEQALQTPHPWHQQSTDFTCGPAALLMAMASLQPERPLCLEEELDIWREATTIFMTSGHGGCHPLGLALAAHARGFPVEVWLKASGTLFLEGVRAPEKKQILKVVHQQFQKKCARANIPLHREEINLSEIEQLLGGPYAILMLISTYRFNGQKAPHWVQITAIDAHCLYVHDPDPDEGQRPIDCQHIPIARSDFESMSAYGRSRLKTALVLRKPQAERSPEAAVTPK
ncbi:MAG: peptidase C39 family protein [Kiritimatiellia bacterium]